LSPRDQGDTTVCLTAGEKKDWAVRRHPNNMAPLSYIQKQVDCADLPVKEGIMFFLLPLSFIPAAPHSGTNPSLNLPPRQCNKTKEEQQFCRKGQN